MKPNPLNTLKASAIAAALLVLAAAARAEVEDTITKSFKVQPGGQIYVDADRGSIEVKTADAESVDVEVTRKACGSRSTAEKTLKDHVVTITQDGNKVEVRGKYNGGKSTGWSWFGGTHDLQVKFLITVPRKFDVDLNTAGGGIKVAGLAGKVLAHTSGGGLKFEQIEGPISAQTSGGGITVTRCKGDVDIDSSGGGLNLSEIEGNLNAHTSGGGIRADKLTGKSVVKTSGGGIEVAAIKGQIEAHTSGGGITADLLEQPTGDCSFKTSGGSITIILAENAAVNVDARTSAGRVSTDFPVVSVIQGEQKKNELRGKINGGGPLITADTSGGGVHLQKR